MGTGTRTKENECTPGLIIRKNTKGQFLEPQFILLMKFKQSNTFTPLMDVDESGEPYDNVNVFFNSEIEAETAAKHICDPDIPVKNIDYIIVPVTYNHNFPQ